MPRYLEADWLLSVNAIWDAKLTLAVHIETLLFITVFLNSWNRTVLTCKLHTYAKLNCLK